MKAVTSLAVVASLVGGLAGCTKGEEAAPKPARPVKAQAVVAAPPPAGVRYSASIEPQEQVQLAFKSSGYIEQMLQRRGADGQRRVVQQGERITKGTVLARVGDADARAHVNEGRARLAEADAAIEKARLDLDRARTLFAADSLTKPELDGALASFQTSEAKAAAARAGLQLSVNALRDCTLSAPVAGVLLERKVEVGSLVAPGTVGFLLGDVSAVKARFGIPDGMIHSVAPGDVIGVAVEAVAGATFQGRVTAIAPAADPQSRVFDVEVTIPNVDGRLRPGMIGTVAIGAGAARDTGATQILTVPVTAIVKADATGNQYAVLVVERRGGVEVVRKRRVELGDVMGNAIAVLKGVNAGERVVISGAAMLVDGEVVRVVS